MARDVVIVGAARTPIGSLPGGPVLAHRAAARRRRHQGGARARRRRPERRWTRSGWATSSRPASGRRRPARRPSSRDSPTPSPATPSTRSAARASRPSSPPPRPSRWATPRWWWRAAWSRMCNAPYLSLHHAAGRPDGQRRVQGRDDPRRPVGRLQPACTWACAPRCAPRTSRSAAPPRTSSRCESTERAIRRPEGRRLQGRDRPGRACRRRRATRSSSPRTRGRRLPGPRRSRRSSRSSRRTARSPRPTRRRINDGAAALVLMSAERAKAEGRTVLGRIRRLRPPPPASRWSSPSPRPTPSRSCSSGPKLTRWPTSTSGRSTRPSPWSPSPTTSSSGSTPRKVNVRGGAVVARSPHRRLGGRLLVTLLYAMKDLERSAVVASLCIGGGEGIALMVER